MICSVDAAPRAEVVTAPQTEKLKATFSPTASHMISVTVYVTQRSVHYTHFVNWVTWWK